MTDTLLRYWNMLTVWIKRRWHAVREYQWKQLLVSALAVMDAVPGVLAWVLEVVSIATAVGCAWQAARYGLTLHLLPAAGFILLAGLLVGLALLTDYYTRPSDSKQGGGG